MSIARAHWLSALLATAVIGLPCLACGPAVPLDGNDETTGATTTRGEAMQTP